MSEQDDIFDIEDFINEKAPPNVKKSWKELRGWINDLEAESDAYRKLVRSLAVIKATLNIL